MHEASRRPLWIEAPDEVAPLCARAGAAGRIALDTEADSFHSYHHKLCLVQLSFDDVDALFDPLALGRAGLEPLVALLADRRVVKVLHGSDYDLRVLDRDLGSRVHPVRDTQLAAQLLGEPSTGLASLAERELGFTLDKSLQRMDWSIRPLSEAALAYAASDTAHLLELFLRLERRLAALGRETWWEEECEALELVRWCPPERDPLAFEKLKGARRVGGADRDRLAALFAWREATASHHDVAAFRVLRNEALVALATSPPADAGAMAKVPFVGQATARRYGRELLALLASPPSAPARRPRPQVRPDREQERRLRALRDARDRVAAELGLAPGVLAPRAALEAVATARPRDREALERCLERRWRAVALEEALLAVVSTWDGAAAPADAAPL
jgi:ribonuclease D